MPRIGKTVRARSVNARKRNQVVQNHLVMARPGVRGPKYLLQKRQSPFARNAPTIFPHATRHCLARVDRSPKTINAQCRPKSLNSWIVGHLPLPRFVRIPRHPPAIPARATALTREAWPLRCVLIYPLRASGRAFDFRGARLRQPFVKKSVGSFKSADS